MSPEEKRIAADILIAAINQNRIQPYGQDLTPENQTKALAESFQVIVAAVSNPVQPE